MKNKVLLFLLCCYTSMLFSQEVTKLMTYNIKLDHPKAGDNNWDNRKGFMMRQISFYEPAILGVQEAMPNQMVYMDSVLSKYSYVGVGRDNGKDLGEYSAIFYNKEKFKIVESSTFWLSETPEKVSMGWDAVCNRVCTYAHFENLENRQHFWVFNTHFDHVGKIARLESSKLILQKIKELNKQNLAVILMGDFNLEPETETIKLLKTALKDSKDVSKTESFGPEGTFNGFHFNKPVTRRIDYIFVSKKIKVNKHAVLSDSWNCEYPSDHLPVYIEASF